MNAQIFQHLKKENTSTYTSVSRKNVNGNISSQDSIKKDQKPVNSFIDFSLNNILVGENLASASDSRISAIQPKLKIGKPNDKYEQEADQMAGRILNMNGLSIHENISDNNKFFQTKPLASQITPLIQRQTEDEEDIACMLKEDETGKTEKFIQRQEEEEEEEVLQMKQENTVNSGNQRSVENDIGKLIGGGKPLPDSSQSFFESRFGADFSGVKVHTDTRASQIAKNMNAKAFTVGRNIFFGSGYFSPATTKGKQLLAHELTHTIQQGLGKKSIQRYTKFDKNEQKDNKSLGWKHPGSDALRVADDGTMAVGEKGTDAFALKAKIKNSEKILKSINSNVKLEEGSRSISGKAPKKGGRGRLRTAKEVKVLNRRSGGRADLTADCGTTAREVLGIKPSTEKFAAVMKRGGKGVEKYTKSRKYEGGSYTTPDRWSEEIIKKGFKPGLMGAEAKSKYFKLKRKKKKRFDRKFGINKYASPNVGQAITINEPKGWNFHFAPAILKGGPDYITVENFPGTGRSSQSWYFEMYGPRSKGQTFYESWKDTSGSTAMVVESEKARKGKVNTDGVHLVENRHRWKTTLIVKLSSGTEVDVLERAKRWRKVIVKSGVNTGKVGWIGNKYYQIR